MPTKQLPADWEVAGLSAIADSPHCPLSRSHLFRAHNGGGLPTFKAGRRVLVHREAYNNWINEGAPVEASQK